MKSDNPYKPEAGETPELTLVHSPKGAVGNALPPEQIETQKRQVTAAQAKVEAIADLTHSAYQRAAMLKISEEESRLLRKDFPDEAFKPGAAGKEKLLYIEHAYLRDRFTEVFGMGQWAIIPRSRWAEPFRTQRGAEGQRVYVEAMLIVRGCFVGEAIGDMDYYPKNEAGNYGDAVEGAKTAAFRRCAKEFGVGLQAWKRDWCEGWWARNPSGKVAPKKEPAAGGGGGTATPSAARGGSPEKSQKTTGTTPTSGESGNPPTKPKPTFPTAAYRKHMITALQANPGEANREIVTEYFRAIDALLPAHEELEDLSLNEVPLDKAQLNALSNAIGRFSSGDKAERAFPKHGSEAAPEPPANAPESSETRDEPPAGTSEGPTDDEWWRDVVVGIPRKGMKRDEYMKNPDTIGSLYDARHGDDEESQACRQRLWGLVEHYEAKGWRKRDGTEMPPSKEDLLLREALDEFAEWLAKNHPDEKL